MKTTLTFLLIGGLLSVKGQNLTNQSTIFIGPTSVLFVGGDIVNNNLIINNGDMQVGGAWINNNQYDAGVGKITFNSDLPQTINHNAQSFSRLTISGGGVKSFPADITIVDELNLTEGTLVSQNGAKIIFSSGSAIIGGSNQAHINGPVYHQGTGNKLFPIGNGTTYLPVSLSGIVTSSEVGITLVEFASPQSFDFNGELSDVSAKRYWEIDLVNGSLEGSLISLPLNGDEDLNTSDITRFVIVQSPGSPIGFESLGLSSSTGNSTSGFVVSAESVSEQLVSVGVLSEGISVYNAISANGDSKNYRMTINNVSLYPKCKVTIFNRWGDKVFEVTGYNNTDKVFTGSSNVGGNAELPAGTYFYVIDKGDGSPLVNGYLSLKR